MRPSLLLLFPLALAAQNWPKLDYRATSGWPSLPPGWNLQETAGVATDSHGHVWVLHRGRNPVIEFDREGQLVRAFGDGLFDRPHSIRVDAEGNLWTVDDGSHTVLKMTPQGRVQMVLGRFRQTSETKSAMAEPPASTEQRGMRDEGVIRFFRPTDVAFATNGDIFVADGYGNSRVVKFNKGGVFVKAWGKRGTAPGDFNTPHSIAVDKQNRVYVADRENYRVQVFGADGEFVNQWTGLGSPWGLDLTPDGHILMADGYNNRVLKLTLDGKVVGSLGGFGKVPGLFHYVHQLAAGRDGSIYTAEILNWRAQKFVPGH